MRIALRNDRRERIGKVAIDSSARPTRATTDTGQEVFLNWDSALDDAGNLRRCVGCGCNDLFAEKAFPQITGLVVVVAFAGAVLGLLDLLNTTALIGMAFVLVLDVWILLFSRRRLVCYRCRTSYHELPIARYHRSWDRVVADRYPQPEPPDPTRPPRSMRGWASKRLRRQRLRKATRTQRRETTSM